MSGEKDPGKLLREMKPELNEGVFVYCVFESLEAAVKFDPLCTFREAEGVTGILQKQKADEAGLRPSTPMAWITLTIHSSLEAVGLTAAVSHALTEANISCNVVAAAYHDHLFVPVTDALRAMDVLTALTNSTAG